jgi:hypothetical protein
MTIHLATKLTKRRIYCLCDCNTFQIATQQIDLVNCEECLRLYKLKSGYGLKL